MAIKIQNSTIIDDSRNIVNAGVTTTNKLDIGIGGTIFKTGTNGYIGIGSTSPKSSLDVFGNINASGIISATTFYGNGLNLIGVDASAGNTYYVSVNGNDNNSGDSWNKSFATIEKAFTVATSGDQVLVGTGAFTEVFPLTIPQGVSLKGSGLRSTLIQPTNGTKTNDALLINGDTTVEDLTIANFYRPGYAFRFANGTKTLLRSPYIQRVTVLTRGTQITTDDPYGFDTPHNPPTSYAAGNGVLIDGSVVDPTTLEPAILFNECTFITPNATALEMTNGARAEWVNCWSYFADKSINAYVGNVGLASTGKTRIKISSLTGNNPIANDLVYYLNENSGSGTYQQVGTAVTITSNNHGLGISTSIYADFTTGSATDGFFTISGVTTNTFTFTHTGSATTTGNVTFKNVLGFGTVSTYESGSGVVKLTGKGEGRFQTAQERTGRVVTAYGDAKVSDVAFKFGTGSALFDGTGDYLQTTSETDFGFGTGDFTIECFVRITSLGTTKVIYDFRDGSVTDTAPVLYINASNILAYDINSTTNPITGTTSLVTNTWYHVAISRSGGNTKMFLDGSQEGSTYSDSNDYGASKPLRIGLNVGNANGFVGYIDELRISNSGRYAGTFTPTTSAFISDANTKLLLHCDGSNNSVVFIDATLVTQDVRFVRSGITTATATRITLADYQQFGGDMRSIGCASVFGNVGITADGVGVRLRLFAYNFGFIGSGKDFSQDLSLVDQEAEVVELNGGRVQSVSIDQNGDFRVGRAFYVNEEEGLVTFGGQEFAISSLSNLDITDGTNITTITPSSITVGNLNLFANTVSTISGNLTLDPSGISSTFVIGDLTVTGTLNAVLIGQDGDKGDITVSANNTIWTIDQNAVTPNKLSSVTGIGTTVVLASNSVLNNITVSGIATFNDNVGIGTTNPTTKLQVGGVIGFNDTNIRIGDNTTGCSMNVFASDNIFMGVGAGRSNVDGSCNNFFGRYAGLLNTNGCHNNFLGFCAGYNNTIGQRNNFFGFAAGCLNTEGNNNNFLGYGAGLGNTIGSYNNFFGAFSGLCNTTGGYNNFFGYAAGRYNTIGYSNNFLGPNAGCSNISGCHNNFLGSYAGFSNLTGSTNIFLGSYSGISTSASYKVVLGSGSGLSNLFDSSDTTKNTQFAVGVRTDSNPSKYWLVGNENFNVGIGTTNPTSKLYVGGDGFFVGVVTATNFYVGNNVIGGGSISGDIIVGAALSISGLSTFRNGPVLIGTATSTGTASQPLQVTGGAYVSGNLGIGTTNPTEKLHVIGNILASGTITANSDEKLKTNIRTIDNALEKVLSLRGVEYDRIDNDDNQIGVIAQEVEKVIPQVVYPKSPHPDNETKSVAYGNIIALLIEAIKEQNRRIEELEKRLGDN